MEEIKKIILLGAGGFLGSKLFSVLKKEFDVVPYYFKKSPSLDVTNRDDVFEKLRDADIVINASGLTNVDLCETDKKLAYSVNVEGTRNIATACKKNRIKLLHYSTDAVFKGDKGDYVETDETGPVNYYAKTKLLAEEIIQKLDDYMIMRVAILYGYNGNGTERSFVIWVINSLKQGKAIRVVSDQIGTPTLIDDIAEATGKLIEKNTKGIYHVSGSQKLSRLDMAKIIANEFGFDKKLITPIKNDDLQLAAPRPLDTSLNIQKLLKSGITMHTFEEGIKIMRGMMK
ncbi:MAG: dTDP-4-dehydrorhamnose reductase [archaeon]